MRHPTSRRAQRGVTLVIGLIMLVLITLVITTAFSLSTTNLKSVGNMQVRDEAIAAANIAIEQEVGSPFTNAPALVPARLVDINNDGSNGVTFDGANDGTYEYSVRIEQPVCVRASQAIIATSSSVTLGTSMSTSPFWNTIWDLDATVTDLRSGVSVHVRQGVRVLLSEAQKNAVCG